MWGINIIRNSRNDDCKPALRALAPMFRAGTARVEDVGTGDGVQVYVNFGKVGEAVALINAAGYETDEDE